MKALILIHKYRWRLSRAIAKLLSTASAVCRGLKGRSSKSSGTALEQFQLNSEIGVDCFEIILLFVILWQDTTEW